MTIAYIFAHFDDEFGVAPLILDAVREGRPQHFLYVADYADPAAAERRRAESAAHLRSLGADPAGLDHVGRGSGALDGAVYRALADIYPRVRERLARLGRIDTLVTPAWEGGHADHDACAALTCRLAADLGVPNVLQFSLYHGAGLRWRFFRAFAPLPENGPVARRPLARDEALRWAAGVRHFPSQLTTWLGLWPAMFVSVARYGWGVQRLSPERLRERPHAGPLYYERVYGVPYDEVRAAAEALLTTEAAPA
jgi:LmbE family N-acetylglucosaminyl deacetylase